MGGGFGAPIGACSMLGGGPYGRRHEDEQGGAARESADVLWRLKGNPLKLVLLIGCQVVLVAVLAHDVVVESIAAKRGLVVAFGGPLAPIPSDVTIPAL